MNRLPWLSNYAWRVETSPDQERFLIAVVKHRQECERLLQQLEALVPLVLRVAVAELEATNPTFLALPSQLSVFEGDHVYYQACLQGRLFYRSDQYQYDDTLGHAVHTPIRYTREMIAHHITYMVQLPGDPRFAASVPLAYRVGNIVGWLTGLSTSQKDDAQAGIVLLATLVAPLLVPNVQARADASSSSTSNRASLLRNKRLPASSHSKKSRKK